MAMVLHRQYYKEMHVIQLLTNELFNHVECIMIAILPDIPHDISILRQYSPNLIHKCMGNIL